MLYKCPRVKCSLQFAVSYEHLSEEGESENTLMKKLAHKESALYCIVLSLEAPTHHMLAHFLAGPNQIASNKNTPTQNPNKDLQNTHTYPYTQTHTKSSVNMKK